MLHVAAVNRHHHGIIVLCRWYIMNHGIEFDVIVPANGRIDECGPSFSAFRHAMGKMVMPRDYELWLCDYHDLCQSTAPFV